MTTPRYSIVVVCKGRLRHLRVSLPRFVAQRGFEVVVVDYACPDGTAGEVNRNHPEVRIVGIDRADFNMSVGRNAGAAAASGDWLAFLDADVVIADDFADRLAQATEDGSFYRFGIWDPGREGIFGSFVVRKRDFDAIGGYDENDRT
jgi:hypothetical protein